VVHHLSLTIFPLPKAVKDFGTITQNFFTHQVENCKLLEAEKMKK